MTVHAVRDQPAAELARALAEFEGRFTYPLGPGRSFRISHGEDYPRFYRAIGPATCFVAQNAHCVIGTLGVAIRRLLMPDGSERAVAYIGDLKIDPAARGGLALLRLALAADAWARPQVSAAYGIVMDGTPVSPASYSGRAGIPSFLQVGKVFVLRIPADYDATGEREARWVVPAEQGAECYRFLSRGRYAACGGTPAERSEVAPLWLMHPEGSACGRLEDTRCAKRLIDSTGVEMLSAHLACFACRTPQAGAELIGAAARHAARQERPALFVAISEQDIEALDGALGPTPKIVAPATVYGAALPSGPAWNINSSEI